jgi:hypothetical protein
MMREAWMDPQPHRVYPIKVAGGECKKNNSWRVGGRLRAAEYTYFEHKLQIRLLSIETRTTENPKMILTEAQSDAIHRATCPMLPAQRVAFLRQLVKLLPPGEMGDGELYRTLRDLQPDFVFYPTFPRHAAPRSQIPLKQAAVSRAKNLENRPAPAPRIEAQQRWGAKGQRLNPPIRGSAPPQRWPEISIWYCSNSGRNSNAGPSLPSDIKGLA